MRLGEAGGADDRVDTQLAAQFQVLEGAFRAGEVNQDLGALQAFGQISGDHNPAVDTEKSAGVAADGGALRDVQRPDQGAIVSVVDGLYQHVPHAPGGTGDSDGMATGLGRDRRGG